MAAMAVRIAIVGDVYDDWDLIKDSKALHSLKPDVVLFTGNFGDENVDIVRDVCKLDLPKAVILGNHDCWQTVSSFVPYMLGTNERNGVQEQLNLLGDTHVGYGRLDFSDLHLSVVGGRPFSMGGEQVHSAQNFFEKILTPRYGVQNFHESAERIATNAKEAPRENSLVFLARNGPRGLGSKAKDICGRVWGKSGGDYGDPDFEEAITAVKQEGIKVPLVVFGHMHQKLRGDHVLERTMLVVGEDKTIYLNAAVVPRVRGIMEPDLTLLTQRHFVLVEFKDSEVESVYEVWITVGEDEKCEVTEKNLMYSRTPAQELPGLTNYASITNEIRGEGKIEADVFRTDKSESEVQLESKEIRNAGKPTSIGDYLPMDLTRDLLGASSRGYVIRTICPDGRGGWYSCALKRINTVDESDPDLARLCHPHVVHLFHHWKKKVDCGEVLEWMPKSALMTFLMMELMDGDLGNLMTSIKTTGLAPFSLPVAVHMMLQIAKGMLYLHEMGVSHPHLKCSNVLCRVKSTAQIPFRVGDVLVKLGGFGCSQAANDDTKNRDVFCFGLTCLEILTGDECFEDIYGPNKVSRPSIPETIPFVLKDCIASCLDTKISFSEAITLLLLSQSQIIQTCEDKMILCSVNLDIKSTLSNKQDIASSSTLESDRQEMFHVHQLHPQLGEVATSVQITLIFFHGFPKVSEEWRVTWLTRDNKLVWPQMWLPEDLGADIRVLSVSFNDNPNVSSTQSIIDLLKILVMSATCKLGETDQAIVLVGHSFGGVVIKALVAAAQCLAEKTADNNVEFQEVLKCKRFLMRLESIVFYSVPHAFANMEFENYISGCSNTRVLQRSFLLKALRRDSIFISDMIQLSRDFENAIPRKTKLLAFLEGKPMSKKSLLVTENSWEGSLLSWEWHKIDRDNHFEVCRPVSKSHIGYKVLLNHLQHHMCSTFSVNVRRVWKVLGTVLICICKLKEVLSRYRIIKCFIADMIAADRLGEGHNLTGIFTSVCYRNYDSLDGPSQLSTSANLHGVLGPSGLPGLAATSGTGLHNDIRSFDHRQRCDFFAANMQDHGSDGHARIGLNLGVRTYFSTEDTDAGRLGRKHYPVFPGSQVPMCQAEGCKADLSSGKRYHRRHKVCEFHSKAPTVIVGGHTQRFCQQCSRFHYLDEFDEGKRSCRRRLADHIRRRRKPQSNASTSGRTPAESIGIKLGEDGDHSSVNRTNDPKSMLSMQLQKNCGSPSSVSLEDSDEKPGTPGVGNLQLRTAGPGFGRGLGDDQRSSHSGTQMQSPPMTGSEAQALMSLSPPVPLMHSNPKRQLTMLAGTGDYDHGNSVYQRYLQEVGSSQSGPNLSLGGQLSNQSGGRGQPISGQSYNGMEPEASWLRPVNSRPGTLNMQHLMSTDSKSGITSASANSPNSQEHDVQILWPTTQNLQLQRSSHSEMQMQSPPVKGSEAQAVLFPKRLLTGTGDYDRINSLYQQYLQRISSGQSGPNLSLGGQLGNQSGGRGQPISDQSYNGMEPAASWLRPLNSRPGTVNMQHLMSTDSNSGITSASANYPNSQEPDVHVSSPTNQRIRLPLPSRDLASPESVDAW